MSSKWSGKKLRTHIEERDNMICCYCGKITCKYNDRVNNTDYATLDHIVSRWEIAQTCRTDAEYRMKIVDPSTLVLVCNGCNSSKQHKSLYTWSNLKGFNYSGILMEIARRIDIGA